MTFHILECAALDGLIASKPAPIFDRVLPLECGRMCGLAREGVSPDSADLQGYPNTCLITARFSSIQTRSIAPQLRTR